MLKMCVIFLNDRYRAVLSCGTVYYAVPGLLAVQGSSVFYGCG